MPCRIANAAIPTPIGMSTATNAMPNAPLAISSASPGAAIAIRWNATTRMSPEMRSARIETPPESSNEMPKVGFGLRRITWKDAPSSGPSVSGRSRG